MQQSPKKMMMPFRNRNRAYGKERRRNAVKQVLLNQPRLPKPVTYEVIDQAMYDWLDKEVELTMDGKRFPTYKLFSSQRISEYGQDWKELDEKGNLEVNFKTITRETNPQHGENQGNNYNIPGGRDYPIFQEYVQEEDGREVLQVYTMKQPFSVNLVYTVSVVTSTYKMLNEMNSRMLDEFKAIERYIFPNGFAMPCLLNSVSDESEYMIDDRKYYAQTYQIKVLAFIIREEDYKIMKVPSKVRTAFVSGENSSRRNGRKKFDIGQFDTQFHRIGVVDDGTPCEPDSRLDVTDNVVPFDEVYSPVSGHGEIEVEEYSGRQECYPDTEYQMYVNRKVVITVPSVSCEKDASFEMDQVLELETIELSNMSSYRIYVNNIEISVEDSDVRFEKGDLVRVEYDVRDPMKDGYVRLVCYDPGSIVDDTEGSAEELVAD